MGKKIIKWQKKKKEGNKKNFSGEKQKKNGGPTRGNRMLWEKSADGVI